MTETWLFRADGALTHSRPRLEITSVTPGMWIGPSFFAVLETQPSLAAVVAAAAAGSAGSASSSD